jgi:anti-sigma28 factor (negative regulator of flagellin synthesis)
MISKVESSNVFGVYQNDEKTAEVKKSSSEETQTQKSKVDTLKEAIGSGNYKIDIKALAQKVADELM